MSQGNKLHQEALLLYDKGDLDGARSVVERFLHDASDHVQFGNGLLLLGNIYCARQEFEEAERMVATCEGYLAEHLGASHPGVATALLNRAIILLERYRTSPLRLVDNVEWVVRASGFLEQGQSLLQNAYGTDRLVLADVHHNQGCCQEVMGDFVGALTHYMKSMKIRERFKDATGSTDLKLALTMEHVAMIYRCVEDKVDDACRIMGVVASTRRKYLGPLNRLYLQSLLQHGVIALEAKNRRLAKALLVKCLDLHCTVYGSDHPQTMLTAVYVYEVDPPSAEQILVGSSKNPSAREYQPHQQQQAMRVPSPVGRKASAQQQRRSSSYTELRRRPSNQRSRSVDDGPLVERRTLGRETRVGSFYEFLHDRRLTARRSPNVSTSVDLEVVSDSGSRPDLANFRFGGEVTGHPPLHPQLQRARGNSVRSESAPSSVADDDAPSPMTLRETSRPYLYRPEMREKEFR